MFIILTSSAAWRVFVLTISIRSSIIISWKSTLFALISLATFIGISLSHFILNLDLISNLIPYSIDAISVRQPFEDAVTADHDIIKVILDFEAFNIRVTDNNIWISAIARALGLNVAECL